MPDQKSDQPTADMARRKRLSPMRIGFLFNHDQIHQIAHSLPIAIALAQGDHGVDVVVATTNARLTTEVARLLANAGVHLPILQLGLSSASSRLFAFGFDPFFPAAKLAVYRDNLDFFRCLDGLVVAEKTSAILKTRYRLRNLRIIHTRHGAGDRAIGFNKASARFDHVLVAGEKVYRRLVEQTGMRPEDLSIIGYPKFDLGHARQPLLPMQANNRPTVLYNPHVSPHLSSWFRHGRAVLDYFLNSDRYNLIFAPHVMLFHRRVVLTIDRLRIDLPGSLDAAYRNASNIHIDLDGPALSDMTYTRAADIYLGDASSQVYEFLQQPRPCVFLDSHQTDYLDNPDYAHWAAGRVIRDPSELDDALSRTLTYPEEFTDEQNRMFTASFDIGGQTSSVRAARAILSVLDKPQSAINEKLEALRRPQQRSEPINLRFRKRSLRARSAVSNT